MSAVNFPQPEVQAPEAGTRYYYVRTNGKICEYRWCCDKIDGEILLAGNVYLNDFEAEQRIKWNAQETARLVIPACFRALGADVEMRTETGWYKFNATELTDWSQARPENFRAKPMLAPNVVVTVNGKEYRWPATAKKGDPEGDRFTAQVSFVHYSPASCLYGNRTHLTRAGADTQNAMLVAALGGGV